jgi:hypothetical protein
VRDVDSDQSVIDARSQGLESGLESSIFCVAHNVTLGRIGARRKGDNLVTGRTSRHG